MKPDADAISPAELLPDSIREELSDLAAAVRCQEASAVESAIEIGRLLEDARGRLAKRGNGIFKKWVECECGLSESTAKRCMRAFRVFGVRATVARTFELTAIHVLAAPSCPIEARDAADKYAESGVAVTAKLAKDLVRKYTPEKTETPLTDIEVIELIKKSIWSVWQRCTDELKPMVVPKFRDFLSELERTGDLSW